MDKCQQHFFCICMALLALKIRLRRMVSSSVETVFIVFLLERDVVFRPLPSVFRGRVLTCSIRKRVSFSLIHDFARAA